MLPRLLLKYSRRHRREDPVIINYVAGCGALITGYTFQYGLPYLIPSLLDDGLSVEQAGLLVGCSVAGLLLTLLAWEATADRWGERAVLTTGLGLGELVLLAGVTAPSTVDLRPPRR